MAHPHVRRILERKATVLIFARKLPLGTREIHDALAVRRNQRALKAGRPEVQEDPLVMTIEVDAAEPTVLVEVGLIEVRAAGFRTSEDFYLDWLVRRRRIDVDQEIYVHQFRVVEDSRYLHSRVHRGYTGDPALGVPGEPQALSRVDLATLARRSAARNAAEQEEFQRRAKRSIGIRLKQAATRGDLNGVQQAQSELALLLTAGTALAC